MPEVLAEIPIGVLAAMIAKTIFAISREESRFTLNGALLVLKKDGMVMVATDGHRLAMVETAGDLPGVTVAVSRAAASQGHGRAAEAGGESGSGRHGAILRRRESSVLRARRPPAAEPQAHRQFPGLRARASEGSHASRFRWQRDEFRAAIERVAQFSDERSRAIRVQVCAGEVKVHSSVSETGESEESIPADYDGTAVEIGFNAQYLLDFLRADRRRAGHVPVQGSAQRRRASAGRGEARSAATSIAT